MQIANCHFCRFLDDEGKFKGRGENLHPFGVGRRYCLGQSLAEKEFFLFFTGMLHKFKLERVEGDCTEARSEADSLARKVASTEI